MASLVELALQEDGPTFQELTDRYYLTGLLDPIEAVAPRLDQALEAGVLRGDRDQLLVDYKRYLRIARLSQKEPEKVVDTAFESLVQSQRLNRAGATVTREGRYVNVGGVRVPVRQ